MPHLDADQAASFDRDGYLVLPGVFDVDEVAAMRADADFILELIVNSSLANDRQSRRLDIRRKLDGTMIVRKIQPIIDLGLALARFSTDQRLLGPMAELMGDEPVLMEEKLNYKQPVPSMETFRVPADDDRFPVHNDWAYYQVNGYPQGIVSSALTIDECHEGNGPIRVFPGTHKRHIGHLRVRNGLEVPTGTVDPDRSVAVLAPPGSVVFFHSCLIHTSSPNDSGAPRRVMIYSHYPKAAALGFDIRNGPNRLNESPWEWRYQRMKAAGEVVDSFRVAS
ncbi:MAG: phytanoyl-CoA dioxygenase family protein [Gammaproteobacteria bacterium]|nr:phytanoyl-CoA dioxygenase family protein [Gammaproteobacteria bacterium]